MGGSDKPESNQRPKDNYCYSYSPSLYQLSYCQSIQCKGEFPHYI